MRNPETDDFIPLTDDGEVMTCAMPPDETVVEVRLDDGSTTEAFYSCNIMEAGDFDFVPMAGDEPSEDESIADRVVAWRRLRAGEG